MRSIARAGRPASRPVGPVSRWFAVAVAVCLGVLAAVVAAGSAAAENPYQRGPDPTRDSVAASQGTFAIAQISVPAGNGFGNGVIFYPTDMSQGTFGALAIVPGYNGTFKDWQGSWLASFGFVVIGINTINPTDGDVARGTQLLAALDYLTQRSPVRDRIDANRMAIMGHSMGGGGVMSAALRRPSLRAAIGLAPFSPSQSLTDLRVPMMLMVGQNDTTVTPSYVRNLYGQIPASTEKAYVELTGADHTFPTPPNSVMMRKVIPWLKIFVDYDTRYQQFLCPLLDWTGVSAYQSSCPLEPGTPPTSASPSTSPSSTSPSPPPVVSGATYKIRNVATGKYLDTDTNGIVTIAPSSTYDDQKWTLTQQPSGDWTIRNTRTGRYYLDTDATNNAVTWNTGAIIPDSLWEPEPTSGGIRLNNSRTDRDYMYATPTSQVKWNTGSTDNTTLWTLERQ
jgi:dienelactone hydrolase